MAWSGIVVATIGSLHGAVVVALVTTVLTRGQHSSEEAKIYESKVAVCSRFVARMYKLLADEEMRGQDFLGLRTEIF